MLQYQLHVLYGDQKINNFLFNKNVTISKLRSDNENEIN